MIQEGSASPHSAPGDWRNPLDSQNVRGKETLERQTSEGHLCLGYTATTWGWQATHEEPIWRSGILLVSDISVQHWLDLDMSALIIVTLYWQWLDL